MNLQNKLDLDGKLENHPLAELLVEIFQANLSGSLRLESGAEKIIIYFDGGDPVFLASNARKHRLYEMLARDGKLTNQQISAIENYADDLRLQKNLVERKLLPESELKRFLIKQAEEILHSALAMESGEWIFSPLVRVRADMQLTIDWRGAAFERARSQASDAASRRLQSWQESFQRAPQIPAHLNLMPTEGFVFSRFGSDENLNATDIKNLSGLPDAEVFQTLYLLWIGGFLRRLNWRRVFDESKLASISSANFVLKKESGEIPAPAIKTPTAPQKTEPALVKEKEEPEKVEPKDEIKLEDYLQRVENATSHYETLGATLDDDGSEIKKIYFALAKRFHPDMFQRQIDAGLQTRVQHAFTEIAHAYEVLKDKESRKIYDYKLRKAIESGEILPTAAQKNQDADNPKDREKTADQFFEQGFAFLLDENYAEATPMLARAVFMIGGDARYHAYYGKALTGDAATYRQAEAELQTAVRLDGQNMDYRMMLADLYIKIGLLKRAEGELNRLLAIRPGHQEARQLLDSLRGK